MKIITSHTGHERQKDTVKVLFQNNDLSWPKRWRWRKRHMHWRKRTWRWRKRCRSYGVAKPCRCMTLLSPRGTELRCKATKLSWWNKCPTYETWHSTRRRSLWCWCRHTGTGTTSWFDVSHFIYYFNNSRFFSVKIYFLLWHHQLKNWLRMSPSHTSKIQLNDLW